MTVAVVVFVTLYFIGTSNSDESKVKDMLRDVHSVGGELVFPEIQDFRPVYVGEQKALCVHYTVRRNELVEYYEDTVVKVGDDLAWHRLRNRKQ